MIKTLNQTIRATGCSYQIKTLDVCLTRRDSTKSQITNFECISYLTPTTHQFTLIPVLKLDPSSLGIILKKYHRPGWAQPVLEFPNFAHDFALTPAAERLEEVKKYFGEELGVGVGVGFRLGEKKSNFY